MSEVHTRKYEMFKVQGATLKVVGFEGLGRCVTMRASRWGRPPHRGAHE